MAQFGGSFQIDKKGTIDLVTDVDVAVERMFRALVAERFPDHQVLAEEMGGAATAPAGPCWVFDPIDGTTYFAHRLPIFCSSLALEIDGVRSRRTRSDAQELFTAERGGGAFLNGPRCMCRRRRACGRVARDRFPDIHSAWTRSSAVRRVHGTGSLIRRLGSAAIDLCYVAPDVWTASGRRTKAGTWPAAR